MIHITKPITSHPIAMKRKEVDKSNDFIASGMTLITEYSSEKYLKLKKLNPNKDNPKTSQSPPSP